MDNADEEAAAAAAAVAAALRPEPPGGGPLMNNGSRDVSTGDVQKLQQQLQDIKEQVCIIWLLDYSLRGGGCYAIKYPAL